MKNTFSLEILVLCAIFVIIAAIFFPYKEAETRRILKSNISNTQKHVENGKVTLIDSPKDAWGNEIKTTIVEGGIGQIITSVSSGKDGVFGNDDDLQASGNHHVKGTISNAAGHAVVQKSKSFLRGALDELKK